MVDPVCGSFGVHSTNNVEFGAILTVGVNYICSIYSFFLPVKYSRTCIVLIIWLFDIIL